MSKVVRFNVPIGPRESTPERRESLRYASVTAVRERLANHSRISATTWVHIGGELKDTQESAKKDGPKVFAGLFAKSAAERGNALKYPFALSTGSRLMTIAETLSQWENGKFESLPSSWRTLYELTNIPTARLSKLIDSGAIHPMMTREEASKLAGRKKKPPANKTPEDRILKTIEATFAKIVDDKKRIRIFVRLMRALHITVDQLKEVRS